VDDLNFRIEAGNAAQPLGLAAAGHGRARQPGLAGDLPERLAVPAQGFGMHDLPGCDLRAQATRPPGPVLEASGAFVAPEPFPDGRGRNAYGAGYRARRFARLEAPGNQRSHLRCCFGVVLVLL
jgi:hypothetical protein